MVPLPKPYLYHRLGEAVICLLKKKKQEIILSALNTFDGVCVCVCGSFCLYVCLSLSLSLSLARPRIL